MRHLSETELRKNVVFASVDSQPARLSSPVSMARAPALLITFCIVAMLLMWGMQVEPLRTFFPQGELVFSPYRGTHGIAIRIFLLSFFIAFALFASGGLVSRAVLLGELVVRFFVLCALLDLTNAIFVAFSGTSFPLPVVQIIVGLLGFGIFALVLLERGVMPEEKRVLARPNRTAYHMVILLLVTFIAGSGAVWAGRALHEEISALRAVALLGGLGPGVLLFLALLVFQLFAIALAMRCRFATRAHCEPVTIIIPALNEAHIIAATIGHIDEAAAQFGAAVEVLILDNGSQDDTITIAQRALNRAAHVSGRVVSVTRKGKAHALNRGIAEANHNIIIRIDADTQIRPNNLRLAVANFSDSRIGVVGGVPIPPGGGKFDRARLVEVLLKHGYYSPALSAVGGLVGVPGMFAAYRAEAVRQVGAFATGMNGEDSDMSFRIGELGFRVIVDPRISYVSEVPATFEHMREQRMRWFRSTFHVTARSRSAFVSKNTGVRTRLILPYMLLNSARRAMMIPLAAFGVLELLIAHSTQNTIFWQSVLAVLIGAPALVAVFAVVINGRILALAGLPEYLAFRALRSWYTLESLLSISLKSPFPAREEQRRQAAMETTG